MTRRQWSYVYLFMLIMVIGSFLAGCVVVVSTAIGDHNTFKRDLSEGMLDIGQEYDFDVKRRK